jgi:hypothetical protein
MVVRTEVKTPSLIKKASFLRLAMLKDWEFTLGNDQIFSE